MPLLSAFTQLGHLVLSSDPSDAENIYDSIVKSYGGQVNVDEGSYFEAEAYATAMGVAAARSALRNAWNQKKAATVYEHIVDQEQAYGIVPSRFDTLEERRAVLGARKKVPAGASRAAVETALQALLGDDFIAYRTTKPLEIVNSPAALGDQPMNLQLPTVRRKLGRLLGPVTTIATPFTVGYEEIAQVAVVTTAGIQATDLSVGDVIVVGAGLNGIEERVTVLTTYRPDETTPYPRFAATFTKAHDAGEVFTTQPFPVWKGNQRHNVLIVSARAASDAETRRKINELWRRMLRVSSTWTIADTTSATTAGPFQVGIGKIGITPIGTVTFP